MRLLRTSTAAFCLLLSLLYSACVREDTSMCRQYALNIRAVDAEGNDLTASGILEKADIYLFNERGFVRMVPRGVSSDYLFAEDKSEKLTLIAWGNVKEDTLITAHIAPGTPLAQARLQLRQHAEGNHLPVTDLFHCRKDLHKPTTTRAIEEGSITLVMERLVAGISIRTRYLAERYPHEEEPCHFIVRGTGCELDFTGKVTGDEAGYRPASATDVKGDVYAPPFRIFPTGEGERIEIDIYCGHEKLCTISQDNDLKPLCAPAGKQIDVDIDFRYAKPNINITIVAWGEVNQETEM